MAALSSRFMTVQGMRVHFLAGGEGYPVVFLHGHGGAAWLWNVAGVLDSIVESGYRVVAIDLPGHGESDSPPPSLDLTRPDQFLEGCLDALDIGTAVVVGGSMGGYVAAYTALHQPQRVSALVLVGPAGLDRRIGVAYRLLAVPGLGEILAQPFPALGRKALQRILWDPDKATEPILSRWLWRRQQPGGVGDFLHILRAGVGLFGVKGNVDLEPYLQGIQQPVLLMWGTKDRVVPVAVSRKVKTRLPHATVRIVHRSGHWPYIERRDAFLEAVLPFLNAHAGRTYSRTSVWRESKETP